MGGLGYYIYQTKKGAASTEVKDVSIPRNHTVSQQQLFHIIKMDKKSIVNDLYQAEVISVFAIGYSMLGKKIL